MLGLVEVTMLGANSKLGIPILRLENSSNNGKQDWLLYTLYFIHINSSQYTMQGDVQCQKQIPGSHPRCYRTEYRYNAPEAHQPTTSLDRKMSLYFSTLRASTHKFAYDFILRF